MPGRHSTLSAEPFTEVRSGRRERPEPPTAVPQVKIMINTVDTGERREVGSYSARHVITTITTDPSPGATTRPSRIRRGWLVYRSPVRWLLECRRWAFVRPTVVCFCGALERLNVEFRGAGRRGFPLEQTTRHAWRTRAVDHDQREVDGVRGSCSRPVAIRCSCGISSRAATPDRSLRYDEAGHGRQSPRSLLARRDDIDSGLLPILITGFCAVPSAATPLSTAASACTAEQIWRWRCRHAICRRRLSKVICECLTWECLPTAANSSISCSPEGPATITSPAL